MPVAHPSSVYYEWVLEEVRRLLSLQDRESLSKTYGCFDRTYWGWKFTDFPGARFQEGVYALAYLYTHPFPGNTLAEDRRVLDWARAGMRFWQRTQYRDGSFDEAYPYEHSLAATAFTNFYIGEAFLLLTDHIPEGERTSLGRTFARAGDWLCDNDERHGVLSNHLAAAAAALEVIYRICGRERYRERSQCFLQQIYAHQSQEGWYEEYGGADPGYQTHATFYLARIWQYTEDASLLKSLQRSLVFLKHFIHPNGTLGGEYGSRNTEFYFPAGFEILAPVLPDAALIARFMRPSVAEQAAAGLAAMDAYNFLPMLNNYLFAAKYAEALDQIDGELPCQQESEKCFSDAGLFVKSTPTYYSVLGLSKGGVWKAYDKKTGNSLDSDCGYWAEIGGGRVVSSQNLDRSRGWTKKASEFTIEADFVRVNQRIQSPWLFIGFRLFTLTLGQLRAAAYWIKRLLVNVLVRRRTEAPLQLVRRVCFEKHNIVIEDRIRLTDGSQIHALRVGEKFAAIHMGSSRYFQHQELNTQLADDQNWADELEKNRVVNIERTLFPTSKSEQGL